MNEKHAATTFTVHRARLVVGWVIFVLLFDLSNALYVTEADTKLKPFASLYILRALYIECELFDKYIITESERERL